jgi:hypothetical protein
MGKLTWFSLWAEVQGEYGTESSVVQGDMKRSVMCWIDTEEPEAKVKESLHVLHRVTRQALLEAIEKALEYEMAECPFATVTLRFNSEQEHLVEVARLEARIEKMGQDRGRWRMTADHRADIYISWHDEVDAAIAGCMAIVAQTTKTWLAEAETLDPEIVFADRHLTDLQKHLRDHAQRLRLSPSRN